MDILKLDRYGPFPTSTSETRETRRAREAMESTHDSATIAFYARRLLELDPSSQAALYGLAGHVESKAEQIALLKEAVRIGKRRFEPNGYRDVELDGPNDSWLFMLCLGALGTSLMDVGDEEGARDCLTLLARFDPDDKLGTRESLCVCRGREGCGRTENAIGSRQRPPQICR